MRVRILVLVTLWRIDVERRLPVLLNRRWQLFHVGEEGRNFPDVLFGQSFIPSRHAGIANAGAYGVEEVPLGIVGRIRNEVWSRRIKRVAQRRRLAVQAAVTKSAIHGVQLHALFEVLVGGR